MVVLNFNGGDMVLDCLRSVRASDQRALEVICVDNASHDGSDRTVEDAFPEVRLLRLATNTGFTGGMNRGIAESRGEFVALLNLDVTLEPGYLGRCLAAFDGADRLGGVTGKLLRPDPVQPPILDTTGHTVYRNRRAVDRGEREPDVGQFDADTDLFSVCAAAPVYRRAMLDDIALDGEYFDDDFFAYFEDFDLSWRAQLRGWRFAYVPEARGGTIAADPRASRRHESWHATIATGCSSCFGTMRPPLSPGTSREFCTPSSGRHCTCSRCVRARSSAPGWSSFAFSRGSWASAAGCSAAAPCPGASWSRGSNRTTTG